MLNHNQSTLPFRVGDRVAIQHGEVGIVEAIERNRLRILLDEYDEVVTASAFDVSLVAPAPSSPSRIDWKPRQPR